MASVVAKTSRAANIDRKQFLTALGRVRPVVARRSLKPVLQCVHLETSDGELAEDSNFMVDEYCQFVEYVECNDEYKPDVADEAVRRFGKEKWDEILTLAKARNWQPDLGLQCAIQDNAASILVSLSGDQVTLESGYVVLGSPTSPEYFEEAVIRGMPEIETAIRDLVQSFRKKSRPERPS